MGAVIFSRLDTLFFFKQKTAYEMRISDWSSDVCSSDLRSVTKEHILTVAEWLNNKGTVESEIAYRPARVLMQDFTGVPAVVDLAAMRDAMVRSEGQRAGKE